MHTFKFCGLPALILALFCSGASASSLVTWDDCWTVGKDAGVAEVIRLVREVAVRDECANAIVRGFQFNDMATGEMRTVLRLLKERSSPQSYFGQMREMIRESIRFQGLILMVVTTEVSRLLAIKPDFDDVFTRQPLLMFPTFISTTDDPAVNELLERMIRDLPAEHAITVYNALVRDSRLGARLQTEILIAQYGSRSEIIYRFLNEVRSYAEMEVLTLGFHRGWAPQTDELISSIQSVLKSNVQEWRSQALEYLVQFARYAGTEAGEDRNVSQILSSLKLRRSLMEARENATGDLAAKIGRVLSLFDDFVGNRAGYAARLKFEREGCLGDLSIVVGRPKD